MARRASRFGACRAVPKATRSLSDKRGLPARPGDAAMKRGGDSRIRVKNVPKASYALSPVHLELRTLVGVAHRSPQCQGAGSRTAAKQQCSITASARPSSVHADVGQTWKRWRPAKSFFCCGEPAAAQSSELRARRPRPPERFWNEFTLLHVGDCGVRHKRGRSNC
jgi:hypothetical protein